MLFSESLACFSPDVPDAIKKLWVANGGALTRTPAEFQKAGFFFCNDVKDSWLNELLSRSLIVRHASWVTVCVAEGFRMPVAPYTLDDAFDESQVPNVDLLKLRDNNTYENTAGSLSRSADRANPPGSKTSKRKRPFDAEGDSEILSVRRPKKKARVEVINRKVKESQHPDVEENMSSMEVRKSSNSILHRVSLPLILKQIGGNWKVPKAAIALQKHVAQRNVQPRPRTSKNIHSETLAPHTMFWNGLLAKCCPMDGSMTLDLSIDDLSQTPEIKAATFDVNETYLGRRFVNLESRLIKNRQWWL